MRIRSVAIIVGASCGAAGCGQSDRFAPERVGSSSAALVDGAADATPNDGMAEGGRVAVACDPTSLSSAITNANAASLSGGGPVVLSLASGCVYSLVAVDNYLYGKNALPPITGSVVIHGNGSALVMATVDGGSFASRFFYVASGVLNPFALGHTGSLELDDLELDDGRTVGGPGQQNAGGGAGFGGAIYNQGSLTLNRVTLRANVAQGGVGGASFASGYVAGGGGGMAGAGGQTPTSAGGGGGGGMGGTGGNANPEPAGDGTARGAGGGGLKGGGGAAAEYNGGGGGGAYSPGDSDGQGGGDAGGVAEGGAGGFGGGGGGGSNSTPNGGNGGAGGGGGGGGFGAELGGNGGAGGFGGGGGGAGADGHTHGGAGGEGAGGGGGTTEASGGPGGYGGGGGGGATGGGGGFGGGGGGASAGAVGMSAFGGGAGGPISASSGGGGGAGAGGALFNDRGATASIANCTFVENLARGGSSSGAGIHAGGFGGAIFNLDGKVSVVSSTFEQNTVALSPSGAASSAGAAVYSLEMSLPYGDAGAPAASVAMGNTALAIDGQAQPTADAGSPVHSCESVGGAFNSSGGNVVTEPGSCGFASPQDVTVSSLAFQALSSAPPYPLTLEPSAGSPLVNGGDGALCTGGLVGGVDERGAPRRSGVCDVGAFEEQPAMFTHVSGTPQTERVGGAFSPLVVVATDGLGQGLAGARVAFTGPASGATATFGGVTSAVVVSVADGGVASISPVANETVGAYSITATFPSTGSDAGKAASVTFDLINEPSGRAVDAGSDAAPDAAVVRALDAGARGHDGGDVDEASSGGCSCRVQGEPQGRKGTLALLLGPLIVLATRRRRRRG